MRFSHHIDTPSYVGYMYLKKKYGNRVFKSGIGSNINSNEIKEKIFQIR